MPTHGKAVAGKPLSYQVTRPTGHTGTVTRMHSGAPVAPFLGTTQAFRFDTPSGAMPQADFSSHPIFGAKGRRCRWWDFAWEWQSHGSPGGRRQKHFPDARGEAQPSGREARYIDLVLFHRNEVRSVWAWIEFLGICQHDSIRGFWMLFAYFGPEAMMPAASVVAAAIGVVMMFGRNILDYGRSLVDRVRPHPRRR
jgi:hypothetical protein